MVALLAPSAPVCSSTGRFTSTDRPSRRRMIGPRRTRRRRPSMNGPPRSGRRRGRRAARRAGGVDDRHRQLRVPIDNASVESFKGGFAERRGERPHEAVDILAPRNTPVHAVEAGTIAKLFVSKRAGLPSISSIRPAASATTTRTSSGMPRGLREGDVVAQATGDRLRRHHRKRPAEYAASPLRRLRSQRRRSQVVDGPRTRPRLFVFRGRAIEVHTH